MNTKDTQRFTNAKERALKIMKEDLDPFHDVDHAEAVERTALEIYASLDDIAKQEVYIEPLKLAAFWHDTSRKYIRSNLLLQPFFDGYISGRLARKHLKAVGYERKTTRYVERIINCHETILGTGEKKKLDATMKIFSDADWCETFSPKRIRRAIEKVEEKKFPRRTLNWYVLAISFVHTKNFMHIYFKKTEEIKNRYIQELFSFMHTEKERMKKIFYAPIYTHLYKKILPQLEHITNLHQGIIADDKTKLTVQRNSKNGCKKE